MSYMSQVTAESIALTRTAMGVNDELIKAFAQPAAGFTGMQNFSLEPVAKFLIPVLTPLRNRIPRKMALGGTQANWKAFTALNSSNLEIGLSDGNRGGVMSTASADYAAVFKQMGLEDSITRGAKLAAEGFIDLIATGQTNLLWATMLAEEALDLAGNTSMALGACAQPTAADVATGGAVPFNTAVSIRVAPLTQAGYASGSVALGVRGLVTRINADGTTDTYGGGTGIAGTARVVTTANDAASTHSIAASVAVKAGAFGYAWFWGASGTETLGALTTINSLVITTATGSGTQLVTALGGSDNSTNALIYDGIMTQAMKSGYGGYFLSMATGTAGTGTPLTADNHGGVVELDTALKYFWDTSRMSPDTIWVASQEANNITQKVLSSGNAGGQRFMIESKQGNVTGGDLVTGYTNRFGLGGSRVIPIRIHPNMAAGSIMFDTERLPYPTNGVDDVLVKKLRQDYLAETFPQTSRKVPLAVTFDGVLQNYAPFAFGVINNIGNG
jgi:hypothetical protein